MENSSTHSECLFYLVKSFSYRLNLQMALSVVCVYFIFMTFVNLVVTKFHEGIARINLNVFDTCQDSHESFNIQIAF